MLYFSQPIFYLNGIDATYVMSQKVEAARVAAYRAELRESDRGMADP